MGMIDHIKWRYLDRRRKRKWRILNKDNGTVLETWIPFDRVCVGTGTYGDINIVSDNDHSKLILGNYCSIADNVDFILGAEHRLNSISTFPFKTKILMSQLNEGLSKGDIVVDDDVWIGNGATILSGVHIGQGAVIATGAVVTADVPPYAIIGGVPAKIIRYRFDPEMIVELLKLDFSKLTKEVIGDHIDDLYVELKDKKQLKWMPKRLEG